MRDLETLEREAYLYIQLWCLKADYENPTDKQKEFIDHLEKELKQLRVEKDLHIKI